MPTVTGLDQIREVCAGVAAGVCFHFDCGIDPCRSGRVQLRSALPRSALRQLLAGRRLRAVRNRYPQPRAWRPTGAARGRHSADTPLSRSSNAPAERRTELCELLLDWAPQTRALVRLQPGSQPVNSPQTNPPRAEISDRAAPNARAYSHKPALTTRPVPRRSQRCSYRLSSPGGEAATGITLGPAEA
jgi:hypothetical protein